jgi:hypothetical protein
MAEATHIYEVLNNPMAHVIDVTQAEAWMQAKPRTTQNTEAITRRRKAFDTFAVFLSTRSVTTLRLVGII